MSDAEKVVADLRWRERVLEDGSRTEATIEATREALRRAADLIAHQAARLEELGRGANEAGRLLSIVQTALTAAEAEKGRAVAEEREACARIADDGVIVEAFGSRVRVPGSSDIAEAIRTRAALSPKKEQTDV